jgi:hypothetical protein
MTTFPPIKTFGPVAALTAGQLFDEMRSARSEAFRFHKGAKDAATTIRVEVRAAYIAWARANAFAFEDRAAECEAAFKATFAVAA